MSQLFTRILTAYAVPRRRDERGDVPGWVMITVMTATIVAGLWEIAEPQLKDMLQGAIDSVHG